jgi:Tfp pilus assembly protein PilZ
MGNSVKDARLEARKEIRIKEKNRIAWHIENSEVKGVAKIHNLSTGGMLIETNSRFKPDQNCIFAFDSALEDKDNFLPSSGRLVWSKPANEAQDRYLCGVQFLNPSSEKISKIRQRIEKGVKRLGNLQRMNTFFSIVFILSMIAMLVVLGGLVKGIYRDTISSHHRLLAAGNQQASVTRAYRQLYKDTKVKLDAVTEELILTNKLYKETQALFAEVKQELEETKGVLFETAGMLAQAKEENAKLTEKNSLELAKSNDRIGELETLKSQLTAEMQSLEDQIKYYEGNVKNIDEGKGLVATLHETMKTVKTKMSAFRQEAFAARITAVKEYNRLKKTLGNNGYLVKNGEAVRINMKEYNAVTVDSVIKGTTPRKSGVGNIDVTFF